MSNEEIDLWRAEMGFQICFPEHWEAEEDKSGDEGFEREDGVDSCEGPGKDQGSILSNDDLNVSGNSVDEKEDDHGESRVFGAK